MHTQIEQRSEAKEGVVRVGDGRGFVVETKRGERFVLTAAHCLPHFPPCHPFSYTHERTYASLLGLLGEKPSVWAECLFCDPIADIAVLGEPDAQIGDEWEEYSALIDELPALSIARLPSKAIEHSVSVLSLDGQWIAGTGRSGQRFHVQGEFLTKRFYMLIGIEALVASGMSGSPILSGNGSAVALVSTGTMNPILASNLPERIWRQLAYQKN